MANQTNEITFSYIFSIMKKSFKRAIIYVLISAFIASAFLFTLKSITTVNSSVSNITVSLNSNITLADLNSKKSTAVVKVVGEDSEKSFRDGVMNNLVITSNIPDNIEEEDEYIATSFTIALNSNGLDLTKYELNDLLKKISVELLNSFAISELPEVKITNNLESDLVSLEYFQIADELYEQASTIYTAVNSQTASLAETTSFTGAETKRTFADIKSNLNSTLTVIDNLKAYIVNNKVENIPNSLIPFLIYKMNDAHSKNVAYKDMLTQAEKALSNYPKADTPTTDKNTTYLVVDDSNYKAIVDDYYKLVSLQGSAEKQELKYISYLDTLDAGTYNSADKTFVVAKPLPNLPTATDANKAHVTAILKNSIDELDKYFNEYKALAQEFNTYYVSNTEAQVSDPKIVSESSISMMVILLITAIIALIAYLVAFFQVFSKVRKEEEKPIDSETLLANKEI